MNLWVVEFAGKGGLIHYAYQLCRALAEQLQQRQLLTDPLARLPGNDELAQRG